MNEYQFKIYLFFIFHSQFYYKIQWKSYRQRTWEPRDHLDGCAELLENFEKKQAKKIISKIREHSFNFIH